MSITTKPLSLVQAVMLRDMIRIKFPSLSVSLIHTTSGSVLVHIQQGVL